MVFLVIEGIIFNKIECDKLFIKKEGMQHLQDNNGKFEVDTQNRNKIVNIGEQW